MKPLGTFVFLIVILFILLIIATYFPDGGIDINHDFSLHFINPDDIFNTTEPRKADISKIIKVSKILQNTAIHDTDHFRANAETIKSVKNDTSEGLQKIEYIQFPNNDHSLLFSFFRNLDGLKDTARLIRVLHFGDSQIECDRITSYIRYRLQKEFGGGGPGLLPAFQPYGENYSIVQSDSGTWLRHTSFGHADTVHCKRYGLMAAVSKYIVTDSVSENNTVSASISFKKSYLTYRNARNYNQCQLLMGYNKLPVTIEFYTDDILLKKETIPVWNNFKILKWKFPLNTEKVELKFKGKESPEIYGLTLDKSKGVAVDNIAMRGSSGLEFTKINKELLASELNQLNIKLIILQYGGNVAPSQLEDYTFYGNSLYRQIRFLKSILPKVPVILIGISDMSVREGDEYVSYTNITRIRDAMKDAAFRTGSAYWDLFEAMGGINSMPEWVHAEPPLATSDYVHFTQLGTKVVAEMFFNVLYDEYREYKGTIKSKK